jgi:hypothetical protein
MNTNTEKPKMNTEVLRISGQVRLAFFGDPWHGPALSELVSGIRCEIALSRPLASGHSIWELVLHIDLWVTLACDAASGIALPRLYGTEKDWPFVTDESAAAWDRARAHLVESGERLAVAIEGFEDARLQEIVPGRDYDFYYLFHGVVQHSLYHGGQIAMLKRALA